MSLRNHAHARWRRTRDEAHLRYYRSLRNFTTLISRREKAAYFRHRFDSAGSNNLWRELKLLNSQRNHTQIPASLQNAEAINDFFIDSIPKVSSSTATANLGLHLPAAQQKSFKFRTVSECEVGRILCGVRSNAIGCDHLNIEMILLCCPTILPSLTHIINACLSDGVFPDCWKHATCRCLKNHIPHVIAICVR